MEEVLNKLTEAYKRTQELDIRSYRNNLLTLLTLQDLIKSAFDELKLIADGGNKNGTD